MKRRILVWLKRPLLLVYWFFERIASRLSLIGKRMIRLRKKIYETHINDLIKFKDKSPLDTVSAPPWVLSVSGTCLVLSKYVSFQVYHEARSYRWQEIYGFILGRRFGNLFIGITFVPITNKLCSPTEAAPDLYHVMDLKKDISSLYPELEITATLHSHPSGVLVASDADIDCFSREVTPNIIISPQRLLFGSPIKRMVAYHNFMGNVRRIKIFETDKQDVKLEDIDFKELEPSKEGLLDVGELATEIDFEIYKVWIVSHPNLSLKKLSQKLSELFGKKIGFIPIYKEREEWVYDPNMKVVDFVMKEGDHLVFPEFFEVVKL